VAIYHDFSSDNLGYDYGSELDLLVSRKVHKNVTLLAKYATYSGDTNSNNVTRNGPQALSKDIDKLWLQAEISF
jgi:hypothetical protein